MTQHFVGIDLHKSVVQVCVMDDQGEVVREKRLSVDTSEDAEQVLAFLAGWKDRARFVVEALGMNRWFVNACRAAGLEIVIADPCKLGLKALGKKTDRRDARELARRLRLGDIERFALTYYPSDEEYGQRKLIRTRHRLVQIRQQLVNQIRGLLNAYRIRPPFSVLFNKGARAWLHACALPVEELTHCLQALAATLDGAQQQIEVLNKRVHALGNEKAALQLQEHLPSVGPQTALTLLCELGDVTRFHSRRAIASYAGLVPRVSQSAEKSHHGRLTKRGSRELRWILSQWAVRLLARNPLVQAWARPRLKRTHRNKVRLALARRLLIGVSIMLTRGEVFSLERCLGA